MKYLIVLFFFYCHLANAFVAGPSAVNADESSLSLGTQLERGLIEPNENRASFQDAMIDIYKLKYTRGSEDLFGVGRSNISIEYGSFTSGKEEVDSVLFYEQDKGSYLTLGFAGDLVHDLERQFGFYLQASPFKSYNENKFSNPRVDLFAFGLNSAFNITTHLFQRNLIHFGSGDGNKQNSYLAVDTGFGYKLNSIFGRQFTLTGSLFLEADLSERFDPLYDARFSPTGTRDRIRSFKYGTLLGADFEIDQHLNFNIAYLQKLGGYDARSTQIYTGTLGYKF